MTDSNPEVAGTDHALAAALLAQTGRAAGAPPSDRELRAWAEQRLTPARRAQVDSHLAHNPRVFERAMRLHKLTRAPATKRGWRAPLALAATVAVLAVTLATQMSWRGGQSDMTPASNELVLRGTQAPHADWRVAAFRTGIAHMPGAPNQPPAAPGPQRCLDGARCAHYAQSLAAFGVLVAELDRQCRSAGRVLDDYATGAALDALAAQMADSLELAAWHGQVRALLKATQEAPSRACEYVGRMRATHQN